MWCRAVKFGGDSGAVQQVSDIGGGFGRVPFTAWSRRCHGIDVKREIISAALCRGQPGECASRVPLVWRAIDGRTPNAPARCVFARIFGHSRHDSSSLDRTVSKPRRPALWFAALGGPGKPPSSPAHPWRAGPASTLTAARAGFRAGGETVLPVLMNAWATANAVLQCLTSKPGRPAGSR